MDMKHLKKFINQFLQILYIKHLKKLIDEINQEQVLYYNENDYYWTLYDHYPRYIEDMVVKNLHNNLRRYIRKNSPEVLFVREKRGGSTLCYKENTKLEFWDKFSKNMPLEMNDIYQVYKHGQDYYKVYIAHSETIHKFRLGEKTHFYNYSCMNNIDKGDTLMGYPVLKLKKDCDGHVDF